MPPQIRPHLANDPWRPLMDWPESATVQWGRSGIVLSATKKTYETAFFEAFPNDGSAGFIRGEGKTLEEAEGAAFGSWQKYRKCIEAGGHYWGRLRERKAKNAKPYLNGGCFCRGCGSFQTAMKPIVRLGKWRDPLTELDLDSISSGYAGTNDQYGRTLFLKGRAAGINIPPPPNLNGLPKDKIREISAMYQIGCEKAVKDFWVENRERILSKSQTTGGIGLLLSDICIRSLDNLVSRNTQNNFPT